MNERIVADDERYVMKSRGQIVANDRAALREYKRRAKIQKDKSKEINILRKDVDDLKEDIKDIKSLLQKILKKDNQ